MLVKVMQRKINAETKVLEIRKFIELVPYRQHRVLEPKWIICLRPPPNGVLHRKTRIS